MFQAPLDFQQVPHQTIIRWVDALSCAGITAAEQQYTFFWSSAWIWVICLIFFTNSEALGVFSHIV